MKLNEFLLNEQIDSKYLLNKIYLSFFASSRLKIFSII